MKRLATLTEVFFSTHSSLLLFDICVGVLVICVLVFTVFCIVCTVFLCCFDYVYLFLFVSFVLV
jgi:hypothetical protein